ncbi:MAG: transposase [Gemmatimonadetes bacterium]|nr:transposase [Gemmatimonadota bacterium]MYG24240.1 transposase [Gemmatimonadota bacterium]MYJ37749.1 transposase [Gemmatimonadota bacterium]
MFKKPFSLFKLMEMFPDDNTAEKWFQQVRWGDFGCPVCPKCESMNTQKKDYASNNAS